MPIVNMHKNNLSKILKIQYNSKSYKLPQYIVSMGVLMTKYCYYFIIIPFYLKLNWHSKAFVIPNALL